MTGRPSSFQGPLIRNVERNAWYFRRQFHRWRAPANRL